MECITRLNADAFFDLSINCADIPGAETINILATKSGGTVCFANLINNYNIALYLTESISRQLDIRCADGYLDRYDEFDIQIVKELAPYLEKAIVTESKVEDNIAYPLGRTKKGFELSGYRKSLVEDFICESRAMTMVVDEILSVAKYDCNVLITGDTGVGKEKVATIIQKNSNRRMQPFIKINCAAIADNLMESEFFGYEKGSFTGANQTGKKGYFEMADNGIIFLDEVGELPQDLQAKLLRVVQDGEFYRVGGTEPIKTNVRIISATNRNLEKLIEEKKFRRDLYYRLNVFPIRVPSLDERKAEIPALVEYFMKKYMEKFGMQRTIAEDALAYLKECSWPGNIRELENVVQRLLITAKGETITSLDVMKELHTDLFDKVRENVGDTAFEDGGMLTLDDMVGSFEKNIIQYACDKYGSTRKAAKAIGISQTQLIRKKGKYQIS
ncbi:sigma-54-dependent Fis family transcriptional regulator [Clostridiales bacterium BAD-6]|uniref:HTH-type transcriptional regulatory protein TyrR n=2 Tax=Sinanaerobacter chloroacetimidivorans TaxID=2818044 RepID=A0A8J7W444_9FIRM|nr:sigma-54-dependent Fis family transcriptional regulator [Sinanaerobacter chloroacetimidivorans]